MTDAPTAITPTPPADLPRTLGELRAAGHEFRTVKEELRDNLLDRLRSRRAALPRHRRLRRHRAARGRAGAARRPRHGPARRARPGQDPADPRPDRPARRVDARSSTGSELREHPYLPLTPAHPPAGRRDRRPAADLLAAPLRAVRREARHPGHQRRRPDRRRRPDQGGRGPRPGRPGDHPLRAGAAHQPGHLRRQRAARPGRAHPGLAAQRARGARHPGPRLPAAAAARPAAGGHAPTRRTTPTGAGSSPRSRTGSAPRSAPTTRSTSSWRRR